MTSPKNKWLIFSVVATGVFMSTLDSSMLNIALPKIMDHFHSSLRVTEWVVMIYLLTVSSTLLLWGRLGDIFGRGRLYACGMLIFAMGSLACAGAPSLGWLISARLAQAIGAALMMALGPSLIKGAFPSQQLGRGFGLIGVAVSLGLMTGPSLGGFLLEISSWRLLFLITVPVGAVFSILAIIILPSNSHKNGKNSFDWSGGFFMTVALIFFTLTVNQATSSSWSSPLLVTFILGTIIAGALFLHREKQSLTPLLPFELLSQKYFLAAVITAILSFEILFAVIVLTPFYLDRILTLPIWQIGLVMMALPATVLVVAPAAGWLSDHIGARLLTTCGILLSTTGLLLLTCLSPETCPMDVAWRLTFLGAGQAMFLSPNSASVLRRVKEAQAGISGALLATSRNVGMLFGAAQAFFVFSLIFSRQTDGLDMRDFTAAHTQQFMNGLIAAFLTAALLGLLAAAISWWMRGPDIT